MSDVPNDLDKAYGAFFLNTDAGKYFVDLVNQLIDDQHQKAEREIEHSRDYVQRAKGTRDVLDHIKSVVGGPPKQ